jgi:hypothetical protein
MMNDFQPMVVTLVGIVLVALIGITIFATVQITRRHFNRIQSLLERLPATAYIVAVRQVKRRGRLCHMQIETVDYTATFSYNPRTRTFQYHDHDLDAGAGLKLAKPDDALTVEMWLKRLASWDPTPAKSAASGRFSSRKQKVERVDVLTTKDTREGASTS